MLGIADPHILIWAIVETVHDPYEQTLSLWRIMDLNYNALCHASQNES